MMRRTYHILVIFMLLVSCTKENNTKDHIAFYHWKARADFSESYEKALNETQAGKIYMHYFDIESLRKPSWRDDGIYPTYVLKSVAKEYKNLDIVPVVYIANNVFKTKRLDVLKLADKLAKLIDQISLKHFDRKIKQIQIDCDWTVSTKSDYFKLLTALNKDFEVDVTIRLHQIKFKDKTGVPPVNKGTLMLYNMGDLRNQGENSILEMSIVKQYVNSGSSFPLKLKVALPLFSQTVVTNNNNKIKLIKNTHRAVLESDPHFKQLNPTNFQVVTDTLYKGFYLAKGYNLKLEDVADSEIASSYEVIKDSEIQTEGIIFYHLDEASLLKHDLKNTIEKL